MPSCRVNVVVQPKSRMPGVAMVDAKTLRVRVAAPPEDGKANNAVRELLAKTLKVPRGRVVIVAGEHTRKKIVVLPLALEDVVAKVGGLQHLEDDRPDDH